MGKKKTTTKSTPYNAAAINSATNAMSGAYQANAPKVQGYADALGAKGMDLLNNNPSVTAAQNYITDTLSGDPAQNPYLDSIISARNDDLRNQMQASLGTRGLTGGSAYTDIISKNLAKQDDELRYTDWANEMSRRAQAAGMAPGVAAGSIAPALAALGTAGTLPSQLATSYAAGTGGLLSPYGTQTQTQSGGFGQLLGGLMGSALSGWATGGFKI